MIPNLPDHSTDALNLPEAQKEELDRLRASHELYKLYSPEFDLYLSAYEGGPEFLNSKNLWKHVRENLEDYKDRTDRVYYVNYCKPLVNFFTNFIFSESIDRSGGSNNDWYIDFCKNVNRKQENLDGFMRQVSDDMQIFGMAYVLVDTPAIPGFNGGEELSVQVVKDNKISPYWVLIKATEIIDWVVDDFDNFEYVKRLQFISKINSLGLRKIEKYTEWYVDKIVVTEVDITDPEKPIIYTPQTYINHLNKVPIVLCRFDRSKRYPYMGNSFLRDLAYNNREVMNLTSLLQEFLYRQCFNILAVETESNIPLYDQEDGVIGTSNSVSFPKGGTPPQYISPAVDPAEFLQKERATIIEYMYKQACQDTLAEMFNGSKSSGFSQAQSFSKTVPFISSRADTLEKMETNLMELTLQFVNKEWDGKVKYKDRYELTNLTDAITQLVSLGRDLMLPSKTFVTEELIRLVHEYDGKLDPDTIIKIEKEIRALDFPEWQDSQKLALIGGKGNSPADQQKPKNTGTMNEVKQESVKATKKVKK